MNLYNRLPLEIVDGIPIFSTKDEYIENYDLISNDHLDYLKEHGENPFMSEEYWKSIENVTLKQVKKFVKNGDKVLDIGVGLGRLLSEIDNVEKYGVDISLGYLFEARKNNIEVCMSKIEELPYNDNFFDLVITTDVLEHVLDLYVCVTQIMRVLKPGGLLIVRVPWKEDLTAYITYDAYRYVHLRNFDLPSLQLYFTKLFKTTYIESELAGIIKVTQRYKYPLRDKSFQLFYFENLVHIYRLCRYNKKTIREFCEEALYEYQQYNFSFKRIFWVNQLLKLVYYIFSKTDKNYVYTDSDIYEKIEISVVFNKN